MKNQAITLGRIGILLPIAAALLFWLPVIGQLIGIAPIVLLLISHHRFSKLYENPDIFKKMLTGVIISIVGAIIGSILLTIGVGAAMLSAQDPESMGFSQITNLIFESGLTIVGAIIIFAGMVIGVYFVFQSLKILAEKTECNYFKTAGLLYFIGTIGLIVFFIGGIISLVGWIFHIVAYFTIKPDKEATA